MNALAKKQRRINPAESENSPINRALFGSPVVYDRAGLAEQSTRMSRDRQGINALAKK